VQHVLAGVLDGCDICAALATNTWAIPPVGQVKRLQAGKQQGALPSFGVLEGLVMMM